MAASRVSASDNRAAESESKTHANEANGTEQPINRSVVELDLAPSRRYQLPKTKAYSPQYAHIYFCRLQQLRPHVRKSAEQKFGPASTTLRYAATIVEAASKSADEEVVLIGLIFRQMPGKPSILAEYERPSIHKLIPDPPARGTNPYSGPSDTVFLEDDHARCILDVSQLAPTALPTGFVVAVRGREHKATGAFRVSAVAEAAPAPQACLSSGRSSVGRSVCLVSGLDVTSVSPSAELLLESLRGTFELADTANEKTKTPFAMGIVHTIIAGNLYKQLSTGTQPHAKLSERGKSQFQSDLQEADRFVSSLVAILPTSLMPGSNDATNLLLPQQPLHRCLLPGASRNANLSRVCNPFACVLDGRVFCGSSGQNVDDLALYDMAGLVDEMGEKHAVRAASNSGERVLDVLELLLRHRHLAPTCPDTLGAYPFSELDPFVIEETPHVFFAGNQKEFASRIMKLPGEDGGHVRLISVPRFDETGQAVFVDLDTLESTVREFSLGM